MSPSRHKLDYISKEAKHWRSLLGPAIVEELIEQAYRDAAKGLHL